MSLCPPSEGPNQERVCAAEGKSFWTDGGRTWTLANSGLVNKLVYVLAVAPSDPATVYAVTASGEVFRYQG